MWQARQARALAYLCDNNDGSFYAYRIYRDYDREAELIQKAKTLWLNHVEKEILPIPTVSTDAAWRELADYAFSGRRYEMPADFSGQRLPELAQRYVDAKLDADEQDKSLEDSRTALEELELQLAPYLLSQKEVVCGDLTLRWKQRTNRSMDYDGFKLAYPLLYAKYVTEKKTSSFEAKVRKGAVKDKKEAA